MQWRKILALLAAPALALAATPKVDLSPPKDMVFVGHCGLIPANQTHTARAPRSGKDAPKAKEDPDRVADLQNNKAKKTSLLRRKERKNPGVGTDKAAAAADVEAMEAFKDGYYAVGCVTDSMMRYADKHGGQGKHRYAAPDVSIIWYHDMTPKEDMEAMESSVCFDFCSTIKGMNYFGMTAGRECYCTPYYKQGVEGSGDCDALCEGDSTQFCGNMDGRANIYQMHSCANAEKL